MRIFISYSTNDKIFVNNLAKELIKKNIYIWRDNFELEVSDFIETRIQEAIINCSHIIVVLSKEFLKSKWCKKELTLALEKNKEEKRNSIIPLLIQDCQIPIEIEDMCYVDFRKSFESGLKCLCDEIARLSQEKLGRKYDFNNIIDWATEWNILELGGEKRFVLHIDSISFEKGKEFTILAMMDIICDKYSTELYENKLRCNNKNSINEMIFTLLHEESQRNSKRFQILLDSDTSCFDEFILSSEKHNIKFLCKSRIRRMGSDIGKDVIFDYGSIFNAIYDQSIKNTR